METFKYIDYTLLKPTATERDIINLCETAIRNNFYSICVHGSYVALAKQILHGKTVKIGTVVGFPSGATATTAKIFEARRAIKDGANEIDMVINLGYLKSRNYVSVLKDISDVKLAIEDAPLKVILEISELNKNEIIRASQICLDARADFIATSTGFSKSGATLTAVKIIKKTVKGQAKVKASCGINDYETAMKYIEAGADRVGTSTNLRSSFKEQLVRNSEIYSDYVKNIEKKIFSSHL